MKVKYFLLDWAKKIFLGWMFVHADLLLLKEEVRALRASMGDYCPALREGRCPLDHEFRGKTRG